MTKPWRAVTISTLLLLCLSFGGCVTKPEPRADDRPCWVGIIDSETAMLLRAANPKWELKSGDLIQTPECAQQMSRDLLNEIYHLTR